MGMTIAFSCRHKSRMLGKTMKIDAAAINELSGTRRMTALQADRELTHLEAVLRSSVLQLALTAARGLDLAYWAARVASMEAEYDLLVPQKRRVANLLRLLGALTPADAGAPVQAGSAARIAA
jgi:hypothetical protein